MLEILALWFLCRLNAQNAAVRGRSRGQAIALTLLLWLGFEFAAMVLITSFAGESALSSALIFLPMCVGALGGLLSWNLTRQGPPAATLPGGNFTPGEMADILASPPLSQPCAVTLTHAGGLGRASFALNGQPIGALSPGQSLTVGTLLANNYIVATGALGLRAKYPLALTAPAGGAVTAVFRAGRFCPEQTTVTPPPA